MIRTAALLLFAAGCILAQPPESKPKPTPELSVERTDAPVWPGELKQRQAGKPDRWEYAMMIAEAGKPTQIFPPRAVEPINGGLLVEELNRAGLAGWEVVGVSNVKPGQLTVILKRVLTVAQP